jgi:hypothetical protein
MTPFINIKVADYFLFDCLTTISWVIEVLSTFITQSAAALGYAERHHVVRTGVDNADPLIGLLSWIS